jgi:S-formylglutathione hydrolase FrmB
LFALEVAGVLIAVNGSWRRRVSTAVAVLVVVACCANQVNAVFGAYPTARYALGIPHPDDVELPAVRVGVVTVVPGRSIESVLTSSAGVSTHGKLTSASIPGVVSGFSARPAKIYLPPVYFVPSVPRLPVLVLLTGQPGTPQDWIGAGRLVAIMDEFAASHRGLAPVVVIPDPTGSAFADPLCLDSRRGRADTYLSVDVPAWIKRHANVDLRPKAWSVAGASYGGTCALQLATNHPAVYPTFVDIAGSAEPTLGDHGRTVAEAFGGDEKAFARVNPLELLRTRKFTGSSGAVVVGASDADSRDDAKRVAEVAKSAGIDSHLTELPGAHDWWLFSAALAHELPFLARKIGLID